MVRRADRPTIAWPTVRALLLEVAVCAATVAAAVAWWSPWTAIPAALVVATRQHALFILYHDAVHGLIARDKRLNDVLIDVTAGVPMLLPVYVYRRFHISHHRTLGTPHDTERVLLYRWQPWNYRPLAAAPLALQLLGDLTFVNQLLTGVALLREQRREDSMLRLPALKPRPETFVLQALFFGGLALWAWLHWETFWKAALLWFGPLLTLTMAIQKVRSFAEHAPLDAPDLTYSWRPGLLGRLTFWPYHISYHREHHGRPDIPWYELPTAFPDPPPDVRRARDLGRLMWNGRLWRSDPAPE